MIPQSAVNRVVASPLNSSFYTISTPSLGPLHFLALTMSAILPPFPRLVFAVLEPVMLYGPYLST